MSCRSATGASSRRGRLSECITDDEFSDALIVAETDLIDAYVQGELSGSALEQFKSALAGTSNIVSRSNDDATNARCGTRRSTDSIARRRSLLTMC